MPLERDEVVRALRRMLAGGPLTNYPKRQADLEMILALGVACFRVEAAYSEPEVNETLKAWLAPFASPFAVDHVTTRRFMVDHRLLLRDPAGATYRVNTRSLDALLCAEAKDVDPGRLLAEIEADRAERKRNRSGREV